MNSHYIRQPTKYKPIQQQMTISPMRPQQKYKHQTPNNYHVSINLNPNVDARNNSHERSNHTTSTQRLTLVQSPSTSFSPFRKREQKIEARYPQVQNVRISLSRKPLQQTNHQSHANFNSEKALLRDSNRDLLSQQRTSTAIKKSQTNLKAADSIGNYYVPNRQSHIAGTTKTIEGENVLNETIDKLDYLERKISSIMHKNDQLRSLLRRKDAPKLIDKVQSIEISTNSEQQQQNNNIFTSQQPSSFNQYLQSQASREDISVNQFLTSPDQSYSFYSSQNRCHERQKKSYSKSLTRGQDHQQSSENLQNFFKHGRGKKIYPNGYMYEGEWNEGVRQGLGTLFSPTGVIIFQGEWRADRFHGRGRLVNETPCDLQQNETFTNFSQVVNAWRSYEGEFKDGQKCGLGVMNFSTQCKYQGHFDGSLELEGKLLMRATWERGVCIKKQ